jgi:hypothetical protein
VGLLLLLLVPAPPRMLPLCGRCRKLLPRSDAEPGEQGTLTLLRCTAVGVHRLALAAWLPARMLQPLVRGEARV